MDRVLQRAVDVEQSRRDETGTRFVAQAPD